jgi:hypothetical protein
MKQNSANSRWLIIKEYLKLTVLWLGCYVSVYIFWIPMAYLIQQIPEGKSNTVSLPKAPFGFYTILVELISIAAIVFIIFSLKNLWKKHSTMKVHLYVLTVFFSLALLFYFYIMLSAPLLIAVVKIMQ